LISIPQLKQIALFSLPDVWKKTLNPHRQQHPRVHYAMLRQDALCHSICSKFMRDVPFDHLDSQKDSPYWNHNLPLARVIFNEQNADLSAKGFDCVRAIQTQKKILK
jgi:hypothetical protein